MRSMLYAILIVLVSSSVAPANEREIVDHLRGWWATDDADERARHVAAIESNEAYHAERLSVLLHRAVEWPALEPGRHEITVTTSAGDTRRVVLRLPKTYAPRRAWPLLMAFHGSGDGADRFLDMMEHVLGHSAERYVIAAPDQYRGTSIDLATSPAEPAELIRAVMDEVHVNGDRVYATGYSLGGYCTWTLATLYTDRFAAVAPMASTFPAGADVPGLWEAFLPNVAALPVYHVWGERDTLNVPGFGGRRSSDTMGDLNRRLDTVLDELDLDVSSRMIAGGGHGDALPPRRELARALGPERKVPLRVRHAFRDLTHAQAYWLEANEWEGDAWDTTFHREMLGGALPDEGASLVARLGELRGEVRGQRFVVETKHVARGTIWIGEDMIEWAEPIVVEVDGVVVFEGVVQRDLELALAEAKRSGDLDRLRWCRIDWPREPSDGEG